MTTLSKEAIENAYHRLYPIILHKCGRMLHDASEAEDVAQEVFTKLWSSRQNIDDPNAVTAWIYKVATHAALDRLRLRRGDGANAIDLLELFPAAGAAPDAHSHWRRTLRDLIAEMPPDELRLAVLSRIDGLTHPEIAELLATSERTVRRTLVKLDGRIARFLEQRGEDA